MQDFAFAFVELHKNLVSPLFYPSNILLNGMPALQCRPDHPFWSTKVIQNPFVSLSRPLLRTLYHVTSHMKPWRTSLVTSYQTHLELEFKKLRSQPKARNKFLSMNLKFSFMTSGTIRKLKPVVQIALQMDKENEFTGYSYRVGN